MPDRLAEVLYKPLLGKNVVVSCRVSGQSSSVPEGVWVQGGGIGMRYHASTTLMIKGDLKNSGKNGFNS